MPAAVDEDEEDDENAPIRVAIIGRPNVGKSSLLNKLTQEERAVVSPISGTTRDAIDSEIVRNGKRYLIIDTAGIRRKGKTHGRGGEAGRDLRAQGHRALRDRAGDDRRDRRRDRRRTRPWPDTPRTRARRRMILVNKWDAGEHEQDDYKKFEEQARASS